jgi:hypothetical protein
MKPNYGRRGVNSGLRVGTRLVATTYGRTSNPVAANKSEGRRPFLVESEGEQLVAQILEIDPEILAFRAQGVTVDLLEGTLLQTADQRNAARSKYRQVSGPCLYTADYVADISGARQRALEVKLDAFEPDEEYRAKLNLARPILSRYGCDLVVVIIPSDQRHAVWTNIPLICQAFMHRELWPSSETLGEIDRLSAAGAVTARDFLRPLALGPNMLPIMVASGALSADLLEGQLRGDSKVEAAHGDISHLQLIERLKK